MGQTMIIILSLKELAEELKKISLLVYEKILKNV